MYQIGFYPPTTERVPLIYDPTDPAATVLSATCKTGVNTAGTLKFTIPYNHPAYNAMYLRAGFVNLLRSEDDGDLFVGRIRSVETLMDRSKRVECEGHLGMLNDSVIPPHRFPEDFLQDSAYQTAARSGNVVRYYLNWILGQHNAQVAPWQRISLGQVTVRDSNNYITRAREGYTTAWTLIKEALFESALGGYIIGYATEGLTPTRGLHYLSVLPPAPSTPITFAGNLLDLLRVQDAASLYTAVLPIGADGLTIESLPDGPLGSELYKEGEIIHNNAAEETYGVIVSVQTWDQVTLASNLQTRGADAARAAGYLQSVEVTAVGDLPFRSGTMIPIRSDPHGLATSAPLTELTINILDPAATTITLGRSLPTISAMSA